jgi:hypothetical protein
MGVFHRISKLVWWIDMWSKLSVGLDWGSASWESDTVVKVFCWLSPIERHWEQDVSYVCRTHSSCMDQRNGWSRGCFDKGLSWGKKVYLWDFVVAADIRPKIILSWYDSNLRALSNICQSARFLVLWQIHSTMHDRYVPLHDYMVRNLERQRTGALHLGLTTKSTQQAIFSSSSSATNLERNTRSPT